MQLVDLWQRYNVEEMSVQSFLPLWPWSVSWVLDRAIAVPGPLCCTLVLQLSLLFASYRRISDSSGKLPSFFRAEVKVFPSLKTVPS